MCQHRDPGRVGPGSRSLGKDGICCLEGCNFVGCPQVLLNLTVRYLLISRDYGTAAAPLRFPPETPSLGLCEARRQEHRS